MKLYRREIVVTLLLPVVLLLMGSEFSQESKTGRWKDPFEAVRRFREAGRLIPVWKPGGIRVSEKDAAALLNQPKVHPLQNVEVESESLGSYLVFPHVADGRNQDLQITTSIVLINTGNRDSELVVKFFQENGTSMETSIGGVVGNEFSFSLQRGQSLRVKTDGTGPIQVGWAKVQMSQPVGGTATFALTDLEGNLNAEVGVDRALLETDFALFAEADGVTNTGVAFANGDDTHSNQVELILLTLQGQETERTTLTLGPNEKRSLLVTELFPNAAQGGIEGVLILRSQRPIGVLTLRQRGLHLTSLPAVGRFAVGESSPDLFFYRVGTGQLQNVFLQTAFIFINNSDAVANVVLDLFQEDGSPLSVTMGGEQKSTFNLSVPVLGALRVTTADTGEIKIGWARMQTDQALGAVATLAQFDAQPVSPAVAALAEGLFVSEVGVEAVIPLDEFNVFADSIGNRGTGLALSNTNESSEQQIRLNLYDGGNLFQESTAVTVPARGHTARFISELFPNVDGIEEFEGRVEVVGTDVAAGTLRVAGNLLTSLPTMFPLHGFEPTAEVEFHSLLGGSDPSATFKLQQFGDDMSLESLEVSMPDVGFKTDFFRRDGAVVMSADTGITESSTSASLGYLESVESDGTVHVHLARLAEDGPTPLGDMTFSGTPSGGFKAALILNGQRANTFSFDDFFLQMFLPYSVLVLPPQGGSFEAETTFTSVSTSRRRDSRLTSVSRQQIDLPSYPEGSLLLEAASPFQGRTQGPFGMRALNADPQSEMRVLFTGIEGDQVPVEKLLSYVIPENSTSGDEGDLFVAVVPDGIKTGPVVLEQGGVQSNPYLYHVAFGPQDSFSLESTTGESAVNFSAELAQQAGEFMFLSWTVELDGVDLDLTGLSVDQVVGTGSWNQGFPQDFELKVESVEEGSVVLTDSGDRRFKISEQQGGGVILENLVDEEPLTPQIVTRSFRLKWSTTVPLVVLPSSGQEIQVKTVETSVVTGVGPSTKFKTYSDESFTTE